MEAFASISLSSRPGRRPFSWRLFRYILSDFLTILSLIMIVCLVLFLVFSLMDELNDFHKAGVSALDMAQYFLYQQPDNLLRVLPVSLLLSTVWCLWKMCKSNEVVALRAAGVSILQACLPFLLIGAILCGLHLATAELVAPRARVIALNIRSRVLHPNRDTGFRPLLGFQNHAERRNWALQVMADDGGFSDVSVIQLRPDSRVAWALRADTARFDRDRELWVFTNARRTFFDDEGIPAGPQQVEAELIQDLSERPAGIRFYFRMSVNEELPMRELWDILHESSLLVPPATRRVLWTSFFQRLFYPFSCIIAVLLGVPVATGTQRTSSMKGFIVAAILLGGYFLSTNAFLIFGHQGWLPAVLAAGLPELMFGSWGAWAVWRKL